MNKNIINKIVKKLLGYQEPTSFMASEAKRYIENNCEITDKYDNDGRVYTEGQCIVEENGILVPKQQAKLINTSLLY